MTGLDGARVAVTGATGLIGRALAARLVQLGAAVTALVRPGSEAPRGCEAVEVDLADRASVLRAVQRSSPRYLVHVALPAGHPGTPAAEAEMQRIGLLGLGAILEAGACARVARLVHVGSSLEVGPRDRPLREDDALEPTIFRGAVKAAQTIMCLQRSRAGLLPAVVVRPFAVYGPYERPERLVPTALRAALEGRVLPVTSARSSRDFVYVDDVADGIVAALVRQGVEGRIFNLGTGIGSAVTDVVAAVQRVSGRPIAVEVGSHALRAVDAAVWLADTRATARDLGWTASTSLEEGLARTAAWMRERR